MKYKPQPGKKPDLFLKLACPDDEGYSRKIRIEEFVGEYSCLLHGNGGDWNRKSAPLCKNYILKKFRKNPESENSKIIAYQLMGINTENPRDDHIRPDIRKHFKNQRCSVLDVGVDIQIDHKDGRGYDKNIQNSINQTTDHFQPLNSNVNQTKKKHCKDCRGTDLRFDAKKLGYKESVWIGNLEYENTCKGCYWHDVKRFNEEISKDYTKKYS